MVEVARQLSGDSFIMALISSMRALLSAPNHLLIPLHWALEF
jgi:hypothetical protein